MRIIHSNGSKEIQKALTDGFCPVECSVDGLSIVDELAMDHHGSLSHLQGVAVRSYRDHYGARRDDPRFVVTGAADADATFSIAALAGLLPHPSNEIPEKAHWLKGFDKNLSDLAELVNLIDTSPIGERLVEKGLNGARLLLFNQMSSHAQDATAFYAGVDRWRWLTKAPAEALLSASAEAEKARIVEIHEKTLVHSQAGEIVTVVEAPVWGFDIWYEMSPVIVALTPDGNITVGCSSVWKAEDLFGEGGLKNAFDKLQPKGWGGREAIGGSPRGMKMSLEDAQSARVTLEDCLRYGGTPLFEDPPS